MAEVQPEERWRADAEARLASLAKPPGALGTLEDWCVTLCVAQKTLRPTVSAAALVFCGDHGCKKADAALSPSPASATQAIFRSLAAGVSCAAVLARSVGATLHVVDVGIDGDVSDVRDRDGIEVHHCKVLPGTSDIRREPAMSEEALDAALRVGRQPRHGAATRGSARAGAQLWRHGRQPRRSRAAARGRGRGWRVVRRLLSKIQQIYRVITDAAPARRWDTRPRSDSTAPAGAAPARTIWETTSGPARCAASLSHP